MDEKHGEEVDLLALFGDHYMKGPDVVVTKHSLEIRCCTCSDRQGHLTCTGCFAVRYCSEQCRRVQWDKHKNVCKEIRRSRKMLLATQASENFEAETVAREKLQTAFVNCGEANGSPLAFRLAAENIDGFDKPRQNYKHMGWMLAAGGMDQEVLNYYRRFTGEKVPRDPWEYFLDKDLDIEEDFYLDKIKLHHDDDAWYIDFMAIALIKYNRLKTLIVNRQRNDVKWRTFMMGTHPRVGQNSSILGIRGIACIVEKLGLFVTGKPDHVNKRISKLSAQIEKILSAVHKKNNLIIPCIMDKPQKLELSDMAITLLKHTPTGPMSTLVLPGTWVLLASATLLSLFRLGRCSTLARRSIQWTDLLLMPRMLTLDTKVGQETSCSYSFRFSLAHEQ